MTCALNAANEKANELFRAGDFDFFGIHLLKFDHFERVLKPLNGGGEFKGFTPRWTLPARLRNPIN